MSQPFGWHLILHRSALLIAHLESLNDTLRALIGVKSDCHSGKDETSTDPGLNFIYYIEFRLKFQDKLPKYSSSLADKKGKSRNGLRMINILTHFGWTL